MMVYIALVRACKTTTHTLRCAALPQGSKLLDKLFEGVVCKTLGHDLYNGFLSTHHGEFLSTTMASWQDKKHNFTGDTGRTPPVSHLLFGVCLSVTVVPSTHARQS